MLVRSSLQSARASVADAVVAIRDVDLERASLSLEIADNELDSARGRTDGIVWSAASVTPFIRHTTTSVQEIVEVASAAVDLGQDALDRGEPILRDGVAFGIQDGAIDLDLVREAEAIVASLPVDRLAVATDELAAPRTGWVPEVVLDARTDTLELADRAVTSATRAQATVDVLPAFLGADGPRRYFVGMQTSAELRGTGGLIGFWGILQADEGRIEFGDSEVYEALDDVGGGPPEAGAVERIGTLGGPLDIDVDVDPAFLDRYARLAGATFFSNVNLDPDLPTTAEVALDLYELRTGETLDGIILLDPFGLERLVRASTDSVPVSPELEATLGLEGGVPAEQFARLVTVDIYDTLGSARSAERKDALQEIGDAALEQILAGGWDQLAMVRAIVDGSAERHLQVFSQVDDEQQAFTDVGVGGALTAPDDADLLAVTANNAVGGKQDVHLGHAFDVTITLDDVSQAEDGTLSAGRTTDVEVRVDNPLPASGVDEYIIGNCVRDDGSVACFEGPPGWNWTWFTAWFPQPTAFSAARTDADDRVSDVGTFRDFTVVDQFQSTPPESSSSFGLEAVGRVPLQDAGDSFVYEWRWWRQSKGIPDLLDVTVTPPDGWRVGDVEVLGGGGGVGTGVHGAGEGLTATVDGRDAHLRGTVTADTRLLVHLMADDA